MMYKKCKLCDYEDDIDYLHPLYDGKGSDFVLICEKCKKEIFSDRERSKREDSSCCKQYYVEYAPEWQIPNGYENIKPDGMRCSEHYGDIVRPAETIWPA